MSATLVAVFVALGVFVGFLSGLLGIGGGFTIVPVLAEVFTRQGLDPAHILPMAIGTSAATIVFTTFASARAHHARGAVDWRIVRGMAPGLVVGSLVAPQIASALPFAAMAGIFASFMWFTAFRMLRHRASKVTRPLPGTPMLAAVGSGIGLAAGMVGTGGAFLAVPFMTRCGVSAHGAVATSAGLGVPIAIAAAVGYVIAGWSHIDALPRYSIGYVYLPALVAIVACSVLLAPVGARMAHRWPAQRLRRAFAAMLATLGAFMWFKALSV
jgi:uncharacterized membrane protein YfcA